MPVYAYKCAQCGRQEDKFNKMADHKNGPECCGKVMRQHFESIKVIPDFEPYVDYNISDKPVLVKSKQHRKELMKRNGVSEAYGKGWF